jgi:hypothetical protein
VVIFQLLLERVPAVWLALQQLQQVTRALRTLSVAMSPLLPAQVRRAVALCIFQAAKAKPARVARYV